MSAAAAAALGPAQRARALGSWGHEGIVFALWLVELVVFTAIGHNFATPGNAFEILRTSTEVGLLALALTPVIVSGGIDLSVGSLMGLSAVLCGLLWRDASLPIGVAAALAVAAAGLAGALNAFLVARLQLAPLIVTLGTYSLFRGLAKGLTAGVETYADFPAGFLFVGQGYLGGVVPAQLTVLAAAAIGFGVLLHRTATGRSLQAIGFASEAARHAGVPVARTTAAAYVLASLTAGVAAVLYVARVGQAKADAGTSYELMAITAVVLGGTSIFGGRGTVHGTVLGVLAIATLQNGLRLADLPVELTGILAGALLVGSIAVRRLFSGRSHS